MAEWARHVYDEQIPNFCRAKYLRSKLQIIVNDFDTFKESLRQRTLKSHSEEEDVEPKFHGIDA